LYFTHVLCMLYALAREAKKNSHVCGKQLIYHTAKQTK